MQEAVIGKKFFTLFLTQTSEDGLYDDYERALSEAAQKNKLIQEHLSKFNAKYGTDFEVDFNALNHDPK